MSFAGWQSPEGHRRLRRVGHKPQEEHASMTHRHRYLLTAVIMPAVTLLLPGCSFNLSPLSSDSSPQAAPMPVAMPPSLHPDDIVGRWGLAAYHRDQDRLRTEVAARDQCTQAYLIDHSADGNILMLGHDNPQPQEMILKGSVEGKTYIGPGPSPAGVDDREVVSFDGQVLTLKWVDPEIAGRYGIMVLARCGPEGAPPIRGARAKKGLPN
jgi:hypothetical protein